MKVDLIKDFYSKELEDESVQDNRLTVHVGILTLIGAALLFSLKNPIGTDHNLFSLFLGALVLALIFFVASIVQVIRANIGHKYERLPRADVVYDYFLKLQDFYRSNPKTFGSSEDDFEDYLKRKMVEATARNTDVILLRSARNHTALVLMALAVALSLVCAVMAILTSTNA